MSPAAFDYPKWLSPYVLPGLPVRWYGVMYLAAFATTYLLFRHEARRTGLTTNNDQIASFFSSVILGTLVGARIIYVFAYGNTPHYLARPWLIVWPFRDGAFVGIQGMSYHGGLLGAVAGILLFTRVNRVRLLDWADTLAVSVPLGYTFGRIGNFINGELAGRVTSVSWGVVFPQVPRYPRDLPWVMEFAEATGLSIPDTLFMVNLPRHPSQLYEALLEGIVLWLILWLVFRPRRPFPGACTALYVSGYGLARFFAEYFRATNADVGYVVALGERPPYPHLTTSVLHLSVGQLVSLAMVCTGILLYALFRVFSPDQAVVETFDHP